MSHDGKIAFMDALDLGPNFKIFMARVLELYVEADKIFHETLDTEEMLRKQGTTEALKEVLELPQTIRTEQEVAEHDEREDRDE